MIALLSGVMGSLRYDGAPDPFTISGHNQKSAQSDLVESSEVRLNECRTGPHLSGDLSERTSSPPRMPAPQRKHGGDNLVVKPVEDSS